MDSLPVYVALLVGLLILDAVFSGAETAFFRLQSRLKDYGDEAAFSEGILQVLKQPRQLLISLLTGNTITSVSMAFIAALLTADLAIRLGLNLALMLAVESVVVSLMILLFGEITPKLLAIRYTDTFARLAARPVKLLVAVLYPIGRLIYGLTRLVTRLLHIHPEAMFMSEEDLRDLAEVGYDRGTLAQSETEIIHSIFEFSDTAVHEIMAPRVDIMALEASAGLAEAVALIRTRQVSKIPIYKDSIDDIRGVLYAKDILPYLNGPYPDVDMMRLSRPAYFVPESKSARALMQDFQARRTTIAIVVDEFGGTAGLVTLEDLVEEVIGELRDPYDLEDIEEVLPLGNDEYLVNGSITLDDLDERLHMNFPEEREYDTLGGFLFDRFDKIPAVGQWVDFAERRLTVKRLAGNRIEKVHISAEREEDSNGGQAGEATY